MATYNKLVRDNIPEIIRKDNRVPHTIILNDTDYLTELEKKLEEELKEYLESKDVMELVDIQEVILAILSARNISRNDFENLRKKKANKNGAFNKKIFLKEIE